jgi:hypothetical protein
VNTTRFELNNAIRVAYSVQTGVATGGISFPKLAISIQTAAPRVRRLGAVVGAGPPGRPRPQLSLSDSDYDPWPARLSVARTRPEQCLILRVLLSSPLPGSQSLSDPGPASLTFRVRVSNGLPLHPPLSASRRPLHNSSVSQSGVPRKFRPANDGPKETGRGSINV